MIATALRFLFFATFIRPFVYVILGLRVRNRERLPTKGPAIIAANHNSHMDTMVLMTLFPLKKLPIVRPVAAADYWLANRWIAWFANNIIGVVPIERKRENPDDDPLEPCDDALEKGQIIIFFPEGSRGEPEKMSEVKGGIAKLAARHPDVPVVPIFLHGMGKVWPRGDFLIVPFTVDVIVGRALKGSTCSSQEFLRRYKTRIEKLAAQGNFTSWV
ncbi:MAG: 1-acyl-sn-glycerol-3-phosphate acyltransferase [Anaerolineales bacterium]|nr:1-acyl-sn-glycerol-3-phosphate acyltransferase [Anaerolineales bacterium]